MKKHVVLGLQFGDEGKGLFTDYLSTKFPVSLVTRFSGGSQAGHTVVTDTIKHVFSHFGSGTLRNKPTYWSQFCPVSPISFVNELDVLYSKKIKPIIFINAKCPITTPYDIAFNQFLEDKKQHGSCGVGFGTTLHREEQHYSLLFEDLFYPDILEAKLKQIEEFYSDANGLIGYEDIQDLSDFMSSCKTLIENSIFVDSLPEGFKDYIFEGSQGLLLDQNYGVFPHVTRANTGLTNITQITSVLYPPEEIEVYLVTRAYQTRHGNGFMTNENISHNIKINPDETNVTNKYQGEFRRALLDVSLLEYGINKDYLLRKIYNKILVITCLDHVVNDYRFTYQQKIIRCVNKEEFVRKISDILNIKKVYVSKSNNSNNITLF